MGIKLSNDQDRIFRLLGNENIQEDLFVKLRGVDPVSFNVNNVADLTINPTEDILENDINPDTGDQIQPDYVCRKDYFDCEKMLIALEYALEYRIKKHLERLKQQKKEEKPPKELHNKPKTLENITKKASINKGTPVNKGGFVNSW